MPIGASKTSENKPLGTACYQDCCTVVAHEVPAKVSKMSHSHSDLQCLLEPP